METSMCQPGVFFFFSSRRRHTRFDCDWSSDVCSSDLGFATGLMGVGIAMALGFRVPYLGSGLIDGLWLVLVGWLDRKSTRLNSSHSQISYAVFCLKKKNKHLDPSYLLLAHRAAGLLRS